MGVMQGLRSEPQIWKGSINWLIHASKFVNERFVLESKKFFQCDNTFVGKLLYESGLVGESSWPNVCGFSGVFSRQHDGEEGESHRRHKHKKSKRNKEEKEEGVGHGEEPEGKD